MIAAGAARYLGKLFAGEAFRAASSTPPIADLLEQLRRLEGHRAAVAGKSELKISPLCWRLDRRRLFCEFTAYISLTMATPRRRMATPMSRVADTGRCGRRSQPYRSTRTDAIC